MQTSLLSPLKLRTPKLPHLAGSLRSIGLTKRIRARYNLGFTLVEVLVVVLIGAIAMSIAVPSYRAFIARSQIDATLSEFNNSLHFARHAAITKNTPITLCRGMQTSAGIYRCKSSVQTVNGQKYFSGDWALGWLVAVGDYADNTDIPEADVLKWVQNQPKFIGLENSRGGQRALFSTLGQASYFATITASHADYTAMNQTRCLSRAGRMRTDETSNCNDN